MKQTVARPCVRVTPAQRLRSRLARKFLRPPLERLLEGADIRVNFTRAWDVKVKRERFFRRALFGGVAGIRNAYIDGDWETCDLEEFLFRSLTAGLDRVGARCPGAVVSALGGHLAERWLPAPLERPADIHHQMPFWFYASLLDPHTQYGAGYFRDTDELAAAQQAKLAAVCTKLRIDARVDQQVAATDEIHA